MQILPSLYFKRKYKKFVKKHPQLSSKADKQLKLFASNQNHRSLRLHKLTGNKKHYWSIAVDKNIRILFEYIEENKLLYMHQQVFCLF